jgi:hypothetical protein
MGLLKAVQRVIPDTPIIVSNISFPVLCAVLFLMQKAWKKGYGPPSDRRFSLLKGRVRRHFGRYTCIQAVWCAWDGYRDLDR